MTTLTFPPTRAEGLRRVAVFAPLAGRDYTEGRNSDRGPDQPAAVSLLSPYLRYRLITEREVVQAVLAKHSLSAAEPFVQEVLWRTYWKGWLEMRPDVWRRFLTERDHQRAHFPAQRSIEAAESGMTGIEGFDDWARELVATGYLHNHARMWFASIWIFTLRLPWTLGADFFLRHLIDGDAASNTLSWRWVAGLQTVGKTYLATSENIARFTQGRFAPKGLATQAIALSEAPLDGVQSLPSFESNYGAKPSLILVTHEDLNPETVIRVSNSIKAALIVNASGQLWGEAQSRFVQPALEDVASRIKAHYRCDATINHGFDPEAIILAAQAAGVNHIISPFASIGPVADALAALRAPLASAGIKLKLVPRAWDVQFWPHATKGFFPFKKQIPDGLVSQGLLKPHQVRE